MPETEPIVIADPQRGVKVDAAIIAEPFRHQIRSRVKELKQHGIRAYATMIAHERFRTALSADSYLSSPSDRSAEAPLLVGLLANSDPAAKKYAEWTGKACRADGLRYELRELSDPIDVENALLDANDDPRVHGIIVYYPIFGQEESFSGASQDDYLRDSVTFRCDVEGLCHTYRSNLYRNVRFMDYPANTQKCLLPCTALSVVKILEAVKGVYDSTKPVGKHMQGKVVTVINRSEIVGRPLAAMLSNDGAEVYSVDINSIYRFSGGRLHKCGDESPESCVRKVSERNTTSSYSSRTTIRPNRVSRVRLVFSRQW
jgi:methylenetetrahydrofolate dehydrogenase (NAD+)